MNVAELKDFLLKSKEYFDANESVIEFLWITVTERKKRRKLIDCVCKNIWEAKFCPVIKGKSSQYHYINLSKRFKFWQLLFPRKTKRGIRFLILYREHLKIKMFLGNINQKS